MHRRILYIALGIVFLAGTILTARETLGRDRADLLAWVSLDDGPMTFAKTYSSGTVGPFDIGASRKQVIEKANRLELLEQDRPPLAIDNRIALRANGGGYIIYTLTFENNRLQTVRAFYSIFAGL